MIKEIRPLSLTEASRYMEDPNLKGFVKKFIKIKEDKAVSLREEIAKLGNLKIKEEHIAKIIDMLPEDNQDLAKIFTDISLDENENKQLLEIIKKYR